jgi:hypothetical protein
MTGAPQFPKFRAKGPNVDVINAAAMRCMTPEVKMMWVRNEGVLGRLYSRWYERARELMASAASMQTSLGQMLDPRKRSPINGRKRRRIAK